MADEDRKSHELIVQMLDEAHATTDHERVRTMATEIVEECYSRGRASPEQMETLLLAHLIEHADRYPSLLDVFDGNERRAARQVFDFMLWVAKNGQHELREELSIARAFSMCENAASRRSHDLPASEASIILSQRGGRW